jgi:hypothetical protein
MKQPIVQRVRNAFDYSNEDEFPQCRRWRVRRWFVFEMKDGLGATDSGQQETDPLSATEGRDVAPAIVRRPTNRVVPASLQVEVPVAS